MEEKNNRKSKKIYMIIIFLIGIVLTTMIITMAILTNNFKILIVVVIAGYIFLICLPLFFHSSRLSAKNEKNVKYDNKKVALYVVIFVVIGLIIMYGIWYMFNKNKLTENELFTAQSIIDYEKCCKKYLGEDTELSIKEIRLYENNQGYKRMVLFKYSLESEEAGDFNNQLFGYIEGIDGKIDKMGDVITDNQLLGSTLKIYWNDIDYEIIDLQKIQKYIDKHK